MKIRIKHDSQNGRECGYGLYINAIIDGEIWHSICLPKTAGADEIKRAERQARNNARGKWNRAQARQYCEYVNGI